MRCSGMGSSKWMRPLSSNVAMARSVLYILKRRSWVPKTACSSPFAAPIMFKERSMSSLPAEHLVEEGIPHIHMPTAEQSNPQMNVELSPDLDEGLLEDFSGARRSVPVDQDVMSRQKFGQTALTIFNWAATQNGYAHPPASYMSVISKLCDAKMFASVWQVLDDMQLKGVEIPSSIFETIIEGYVHAGQVKPAVDAFDKMLKYGCRPTMHMYSHVIGYVVRVKRHRVSLLLYKRMTREGLSANVTVFSALIHGFCHVGQLHEAHQLLEEMKKVGLDPDAAIYSCLIETFSKAGRYYMAQMLLIEMRETYGLLPSLIAYNSLLECLCKERKIVAAYRLFLDMRRAGLAPNVDSYNIVLEGFFRMNGVTRAIKVYKQMPRYNCMPNMETEKIMVAGFTRCDKLSRAMSFLDSLVAARRQVDVVACNHVLHALALTKLTKAEEFLNKMVGGLCTPDAISYTTLMHAYCKAGRLDDAERMFQSMKAKGCKPTGVSYEALIVAYCRVERLQSASELVDELIKGAFHMNASTCSAILDGLSRVGLVDDALRVIGYATDHKLFVDPDKLVTLLKALHKVGRGPEGKDILRGMAKRGCLQEPYASMF